MGYFLLEWLSHQYVNVEDGHFYPSEEGVVCMVGYEKHYLNGGIKRSSFYYHYYSLDNEGSEI